MKYRRLFIVLLVSLTSLADISGQPQSSQQQQVPDLKANPGNINHVEFKLSYNFHAPGKTSKIKFIVNLPRTIPHQQEIKKIQCAPRPKRQFRENGNNYAEFILTKPRKNSTIVIDIEADLFNYDLSTAKANNKNSDDKVQNLSEFLKDEKCIEKDHPTIQAIARTIPSDSTLSTVRHIYNYVIDNMEYQGYNPHSRGAAEAAQRKLGDCTEYSDLFVALCRAKKIPARVVAGYTTKWHTTPKHNWAEVYIKPYGWVPFDPTIGDVENESAKDDRFNNLRRSYIYFSRIRSDPTLNYGHFYRYTYYGDPIKVEDSIEFHESEN